MHDLKDINIDFYNPVNNISCYDIGCCLYLSYLQNLYNIKVIDNQKLFSMIDNNNKVISKEDSLLINLNQYINQDYCFMMEYVNNEIKYCPSLLNNDLIFVIHRQPSHLGLIYKYKSIYTYYDVQGYNQNDKEECEYYLNLFNSLGVLFNKFGLEFLRPLPRIGIQVYQKYENMVQFGLCCSITMYIINLYFKTQATFTMEHLEELILKKEKYLTTKFINYNQKNNNKLNSLWLKYISKFNI